MQLASRIYAWQHGNLISVVILRHFLPPGSDSFVHLIIMKRYSLSNLDIVCSVHKHVDIIIYL